MGVQIRPTETFLFYDIPQVFAAEDKTGQVYACFLHEERKDGPVFLCGSVARNSLDGFRSGQLSLRAALQNGHSSKFYLLATTPIEGEWHSVEPFAEVVDDSILPDDSVRLEPQKTLSPSPPIQVGVLEHETQQRTLALFQQTLGYRYLGNWKTRQNNSNVEEEHFRAWLDKQGHSEKIIDRVMRELGKAKALGGTRTLYEANREVYSLLRYGVKVCPDVGEQTVTVWLIDWIDPHNNDFAVAEEVTVSGLHDKRPDVVLYVNGTAFAVLELKRSSVAITEGIRQNLDNQKKEFIRPFFATVQLVLAGNTTEGLRYAPIETKEKYWLAWKEENPDWKPGDPPANKYLAEDVDGAVQGRLDCALSRLVDKRRLLEIIHDFIVFDAGIKKTCRHNQYFGVRAAQKRIVEREDGIIWHTQGSGKSLTMVWLAKWIREHVENARVLIITDRTELDDQIEKVFTGVDEQIYRTKSGSDLVSVLNRSDEWLICSLIHKFGGSDKKDIAKYLQEVLGHLPAGFHAKGELFVFVDECHRTQSDKLHTAMKKIVREAMLIGFTGTPLLKKDKRKSIEVFGTYIHTYKYNEAVRDGVVLDLRYEARDIDQRLTSQDKVDKWFEAKTKGLSDLGRAHLKQRWGTMQKVLSCRDRLERIVADINLDMIERDRLMNDHGNALLVSDSVYSACRLYEMFQKTDLKDKCAIITSYKPSPSAIKGEETGEGLTERMRKYDIYRKMLADFFDESEESAMYKVDEFEKIVKKRFIEQPGQMKLLIVVDKLLTGFDAPPATYLYIDKKMQDHGLFQAVCRVNRLDGEDKEYGYIVDYKDLFDSLTDSFKDYTGKALDGFDEEDVADLLKDRLVKGRERLEELREALAALCEPVEPPRDQEAFLRFFCGTSEDPTSNKANEPKRVALYKLTSSFVRAYANLSNEMREAGYSEAESAQIKKEVRSYEKLREEVKLRSADYVDMKVFEPAMRHLLDTYIRADESEVLSAFEDMSLVEMLVDEGEKAIDKLPKGLKDDSDAMAETIENNVRKVIIDEMAVNPKFYDKMSQLLDELIAARKSGAIDYREYLEQIVALAKSLKEPASSSSYPASINNSVLQALYDNLDNNETLAVQVDKHIREVKKADWRGNKMKEREVRNAIKLALGDKGELLDAIFEIVKNQRDY